MSGPPKGSAGEHMPLAGITDEDAVDALALRIGLARALARQGYSDGQIARVLRISRSKAWCWQIAARRLLRVARLIEETFVDGPSFVGEPPAPKAVIARARTFR